MDEHSGEAVAFDPVWYVQRYAGVARAIERGRFRTALEHFQKIGRAQGKAPSAEAERRAKHAGRAARDAEEEPGADAPAEPLRRADMTRSPPHIGKSEAVSIDPSLATHFPHHNGAAYLVPTALSRTVVLPGRVALIGSCLLGAWSRLLRPPAGCTVDHILVNHLGDLPEGDALPAPPDSYDLIVAQTPLRAITPPGLLSGLDYGSTTGHQAAFDEACAMLEQHVAMRLRWNVAHGIPAFVTSFLVPQRNPMGLLFPRHDLRNPEHFVARLNEVQERIVRGYRNAYILDVDRIAASVGRRHVQDDAVEQTSHGSILGRRGPLLDRMEPVAPLIEHFAGAGSSLFYDAVWSELVAMWRVLRQADAIKLVVVDLDDTLWNGVSGDTADISPAMAEGWPLGVAEALRYLRQRGILLAIISRNEESRIRVIWESIMRRHLSLDDFAAVIINWQPKVDNMRALLEAVNLLPRSVVFIDDNPAERAAMAAAFPDMRIIGRHPYYIRTTLLWATETQVPAITAESAARTDMVQKQLEREGARKQMSRDDFLRAAAPAVSILVITRDDHPRFARALELLNKTNQFNTTGTRWPPRDLAANLRAGAVLYCFEAEDSFTAYGLVGVVIVDGTTIVQWVMSCRILGYRIEDAVMAEIVAAIRRDGPVPVTGRLIETDVNFPCRSLFAQCGFQRDGEVWTLPAGQAPVVPSHVTVRSDAAAPLIPA